jgi:hypothetical protein
MVVESKKKFLWSLSGHWKENICCVSAAVELLLQHNCNVNQVDSRGNSALHALANKVAVLILFFMDADMASSLVYDIFVFISPERYRR